MASDDPVLGAEVFEIQPEDAPPARGHGVDIGLRQVAGERLDDDIGRLGTRPLAGPAANIDAFVHLLISLRAGRRTQPGEGIQVVHPQPHPLAVLGSQLTGQAPGDADVTEVIHDRAENVPTRPDRQSMLLEPLTTTAPLKMPRRIHEPIRREEPRG